LILLLEVVEIPSVIFILVWFAIQGASGYLSIHNQSSVAWFSHIGGFLMGVIVGIHHRWFR
jgi:membrane associated rhomboid family serine protease